MTVLSLPKTDGDLLQLDPAPVREEWWCDGLGDIQPRSVLRDWEEAAHPGERAR